PRPGDLQRARPGARWPHFRRERARQRLGLHRHAAAALPARARKERRLTRVLVVEDDNVARDLLCEILRGEGYEVDAADDGSTAIARAKGSHYDLVVSDV